MGTCWDWLVEATDGKLFAPRINYVFYLLEIMCSYYGNPNTNGREKIVEG